MRWVELQLKSTPHVPIHNYSKTQVQKEKTKANSNKGWRYGDRVKCPSQKMLIRANFKVKSTFTQDPMCSHAYPLPWK